MKMALVTNTLLAVALMHSVLVFGQEIKTDGLNFRLDDVGVLTVRHSSVPEASIRSSREGLWSIGTGWEGETAAHWNHGIPTEVSRKGEWTIASGVVSTDQGDWAVTDQFRAVGDELVQAKRRWQFNGPEPSGAVVLSIRFTVDRLGETPLRPFLPGIQYYGNPSGTRIDASRVPTWSGSVGSEAFYEEHRYPLPFASVEQDQEFVAAMHSRPSKLAFAARDDLWWSLGVAETKTGTDLVLQSGPVASNGKRGMVKARQKSFLPYQNAHLTNVSPGAVIEKEYWIQLAPAPTKGHGFRHPLWKSISLFDPQSDLSMPRPKDVIAAKLRDTFDRWHEDDQCRGFRTRPPHAQPWFMMGWADRAEVPGHALLTLDLSNYCDDSSLWQARAASSLDFLTTSPVSAGKRKGGFSIVYDYEKHQWLNRQNPLSQAQSLLGIARAVRSARQNRSLEADSSKWESFLRSELARIESRVMKPDWHPVSTNEAFAMAPLVIGSELLEDDSLMIAARKIADHTIERHSDMTEPYWGGTLDAKCEDKEGAWAALQGFAALYEVHQEKKYLDAAIHAADVCLSYLYVWDVDLPPGRLADHAVKTRGWTGVSVQNQHLDVFGVVFTPVLWQLGDWTGDARYHQLAKVMFVSCGQMTDLASGVQGEQLFQTNYQQHDAGNQVEGMRGGYSEVWNIYWISAHFLTAAAEFDRLGIAWEAF